MVKIVLVPSGRMNFRPKFVCLPANSTVLEPTPGAGNLVKALEVNYKVFVPKWDFWDEEDVIHSQKFDAVVMNPPFADGESILMKSMQLADKVVAIIPWITVLSSDKRTVKLKQWGIERIWHLPRKCFTGISVPLMALFLTKGYKGDVTCRFVDYVEEIKPNRKKRPVW